MNRQNDWTRVDVRTSSDFAVTARRKIAGSIDFYTDYDAGPDDRTWLSTGTGGHP